MRKKVKKKEPQDGGLDEMARKRLRTAVRQVWSWTSHARRLVLKRCKLPNGFSRCEECKRRVPKVLVDHIKPCGVFDSGFIERCFVSSREMQGLCEKCHRKKTNLERKERDLGL